MLDDCAGPDIRADPAGPGWARGLEPAAGRVPAHARTPVESASGSDPRANPAKDPKADSQAYARAQPCAVARATSRLQAD
jgi:hypothetical protein